ncbi:hypothetical protein TWF718_005328 [Orbilia javanica]|uniref:BTB domain-containing protein n=1 Tax=Orbilia javanica TaxID=47235 RepID=A0AAN8RNU3_9PEZI
MSAAVGLAKERGFQTGASKQPWCEDGQGSLTYKVAHGKPIGIPIGPIDSPKASADSPRIGGKLSSFMQPTAASSSKAKANTDSHMTILAAGVSRSPIIKKGRRSGNFPSKEEMTLLEDQNTGLASFKKSSQKLPSAAAETEQSVQTSLRPPRVITEKVDLNEYTQELMRTKAPVRPLITNQSDLVSAPELNLGRTGTPVEFQNRPSSSVAIRVQGTPDENFDPELFRDLKRMVLELGAQAKGESDDLESIHTSKNSTSSATMATDSHAEQPYSAGEQSPDKPYTRFPAEFEQYETEPDPEHNLVVIVGPDNIAFSLNSDAIVGHSYTIAEILEELGVPPAGEVQELVFQDIDPYGFFYILRALFAGTFPTPEASGRNAEALMLDAALYLHMPHVISILRRSISERLKNETLDIEVALRFANTLYKHGTVDDVRDFWHEDAFVRRALRQTTVIDLIERSPGLFDDRTWMVRGFKHGLSELLGKTRLRT